jgi:hypothetical protein
LGSEKARLAVALAGLAETLVSDGIELDFLAVKKAARRVPRVVGQRMEWAKGLQLDAMLARQLNPGHLEDGLRGLRAMPSQEIRRALASFLEDAKVKILEAVLEAKTAKGSRSAHEANSKFDGFQGNFASIKDFHAGAEASLNLGYPNPDTVKGIRHEHTRHPSVERLFVTPNYRIVTNLFIEFVWAMYEACPEDPESKELLRKAQDLIRELVVAREGDASASAAIPADQLLFPGEVGDTFSESLVMFSFPGVAVDSANEEKVRSAVKAKAVALLKTKEEKVRGIAILDHTACMERIQREDSVLRPEPSARTAIVDNSLRAGVMLPMSSDRAKMILGELQTAVADAAGLAPELIKADVSVCTWAFRRYAGVHELRGWLAELSLDDLTKILADDKQPRVWALDPNADLTSHEAVCHAMVASFVRTELRADLQAALESGASDAQIEGLLRGWNVQEPWSTERVGRIEQAVAALDSEEKWCMVESWVRLYRGRIQGRMRLGLKALMEREAKKIQQYGLTKGEVLGSYIYTGPAFLPLNSICRSFPQNMLDLLKGNETTADNKMCTTLFCISSAIKKISQNTEQPENGCPHQLYVVSRGRC